MSDRRKFILPSREAQDEAIAGLREHSTIFVSLHKRPLPDGYQHCWDSLLLAHGRGLYMDANTFAAKRMKIKQCFANAAHLALDGGGTYVEGKVSCHGVALAHAWVVDRNGNVIDPTIRPHAGIGGYFGIPFKREYLRATILKHRVYGLLDYWNMDILKSTDATEWKEEL